MKKLFLILSFFTAPFLSQAQFENATTKTIEKLVDNIDRNASFINTRKVIGDTTINYWKEGNKIHKLALIVKTDTLITNQDFYYKDGELIFILESKLKKANGSLTQSLFSSYYYNKGAPIYNTNTTRNRDTVTSLKPTDNLYEIGIQHINWATKTPN